MGLPEPMTLALLGATALLSLAALAWQRQRRRRDERRAAREELDTVADWPPDAVRVLSISERRALDLVRSALPGFLVLAQVPLSRFIRVPAQHSHREWLLRAGGLSADLLICDGGSRVLMVVDVRAAAETERSRQRHERMARVLRGAGIGVVAWYEDRLPTAAEARKRLGSEMATVAARRGRVLNTQGTASRPMPLIPVAEIEAVLNDGDAAYDTAMEPVPSAFFDDLDTPPRARAAARLH